MPALLIKPCSIEGAVMNNYINIIGWNTVTRLTALVLLACSFSAHATAPRIAAQMFGDEKKADIVSYQSTPDAANSESELTQAIVTEAFKASGKSPIIDVLPSKQLAVYALFNNEVVALLGSTQDLAGQDKKLYRVVTFYLSKKNDDPVVLIFSASRGKELHKSFLSGMQKIVKSGKYLQLLETSRGKLPADYIDRLKRLNTGWK
jgi:outer membrane lipoprotein-sorting protein